MRALLFALLLPVPAFADDITVFAAASLQTALDQVAADWQATTGDTVTLVYGGTPAMARQIEQGAPADIFIAASVDWMDHVADAGFVQAGTRRDILGNELVLITHGMVSLYLQVNSSLQLQTVLRGGKLSMAQVDSVPAGQYGREALVSLGLWDSVKDDLVQSENVRAALQLVALGEAELGIVYASDAIAADNVTIIGRFPASSHSPIVYPAALIGDAGPAAEAFLDALTAPAAQAVFAANGFTPR